MSDDPEFTLPAWSIRWLESCASTSDELRLAARSGAASGLVLATTCQSAGRGRRGHAWVSEPGEGLAFSALWHAPIPADRLGWVALAAGVATATAIEAQGAGAIQLKWPNDLLHGGAKLGGILVETVAGAAPPGHTAVSIGIGINLAGGDRLARSLGRAVTDLGACGERGGGGSGGALVEPQVLTAAILRALDAWLRVLAAGEVVALQDAWSSRDALSGRTVSIEQGAHRLEGIACGLAPDGALQVRTPGGLQRVHAGEVSIGALAS